MTRAPISARIELAGAGDEVRDLEDRDALERMAQAFSDAGFAALGRCMKSSGKS